MFASVTAVYVFYIYLFIISFMEDLNKQYMQCTLTLILDCQPFFAKYIHLVSLFLCIISIPSYIFIYCIFIIAVVVVVVVSRSSSFLRYTLWILKDFFLLSCCIRVHETVSLYIVYKCTVACFFELIIFVQKQKSNTL